MANLTRTFNRTGLKLKKHSPEILLAAGIVGVVASGVMACKATLKVEEIIDDAKDKIDTIHEVSADPTMAEKYSEEDSKRISHCLYADCSQTYQTVRPVRSPRWCVSWVHDRFQQNPE